MNKFTQVVWVIHWQSRWQSPMIGHLGFICCPLAGVGPQNTSLYNHTLSTGDHGLCYRHECSLLPAWLIAFPGNGLLFQQMGATSRDPGRVHFLSACLLRVFMLILKSLHWGQEFLCFVHNVSQVTETDPLHIRHSEILAGGGFVKVEYEHVFFWSCKWSFMIIHLLKGKLIAVSSIQRLMFWIFSKVARRNLFLIFRSIHYCSSNICHPK